jgi:hypothetical protein
MIGVLIAIVRERVSNSAFLHFCIRLVFLGRWDGRVWRLRAVSSRLGRVTRPQDWEIRILHAIKRNDERVEESRPGNLSRWAVLSMLTTQQESRAGEISDGGMGFHCC